MSLRRLLLLLGLVAVSGQAPRWMSIPPQVTSAGRAAALAKLRALRQELQAGEAPSAPSSSDLETALRGAIQPPEQSEPPTDPEERQIYNALHEVQAAGTPQLPVLDKLISDAERRQDQAKRLSSEAWDGWLSLRAWYAANRAEADSALQAVPAIVVIFGFAALAFKAYAQARFCGDVGWTLSRRWLQVLSWGCAALALFAGSNPWPLVPRALFVAPMLWLACSGFLLSRLDPNFPVWNSTLGSLPLPLLSMGVIVALQKGPALLAALRT
jgi:hypothetical protein